MQKKKSLSQSKDFPDKTLSSFNNSIDIEDRIATQINEEKILGRDFFTVDRLILAKSLLGKVLVRRLEDGQVIKSRIVETEAYGGDDDDAPKNSRNHGKYNERTKPAYMEGGHLYVCPVHGIHHMVHFSAGREGEPSVALIRAVEVIEGFDLAVENRNLKNKVSKLGKEVSNGPGKVCAALKIDRKLNGYDATKPGEIYVVDQNFNSFNTVISKRINIDYAGESIHHPWRFYIENNRFVSVKGEVLEIIVAKSDEKEDHKNVSEINKDTTDPSVSLLDNFKFGKKN